MILRQISSEPNFQMTCKATAYGTDPLGALIGQSSIIIRQVSIVSTLDFQTERS